MVEPKLIATLFQEIQDGKQASFNELFSACYERLVVFAQQYVKQRECAEEITSELFVKLWLRRNKLSEILKPEVYLYVSVRNAALNHRRNTSRFTAISIDEPGIQPLENILTYTTESHMEQNELVVKLNQAIEKLPRRQQLIFRLIKQDGLKCKEVAQILNISTRTVENQVYKAIKVLAGTLSIYLGYHPQKNIRDKDKQVLSKMLLCLFF